MVVPSPLRTLLLIVPALLLCLGGDADAQRQRTKTAKATTAKVRTAKARNKAKTTKTGRTRTAKVTLAGTRGTKAKTAATGKSLVAAKKAKATKEVKSATAKKTAARTKTTKKTATAKKAAARTKTTKKTAAKTKTTQKTATAKKTAAKTKTTKKATTKTASKSKTAKKAAKDGESLTQTQREQIAIERVLGSGEVLVSSTPFNGDTANPITGLGPIEVKVRKQTTGKAGRIRRFFRMFSPSAERTHLVMVDAAGNATKLNSRSNSPVYRAFHGLMNAVPVRELVHDIVHSSGVRNGLFTAILGGAATAVTPVGSIGIFRGGQLMLEGLKRRTVARNEVFASTVTWANRKGAKGQYPNLANTYRHYKTELQKTKPGTQPATLKNFAERLAGNGL